MSNNESDDAPPGLEDIGPQMAASDLLARDLFESGPVFGIEKDFLMEPLGNRLLAERRTVQGLRKPGGKRRLATGDLDGSTKGGNVRFIHEHPLYTTRVVQVNDPACVRPSVGLATVLPMPSRATRQQKSDRQSPPKRIRQAGRGPDNRTLGDRLKIAMTQYARQHGREDWSSFTQEEWIELATRAVGRDPQSDPVMTQQNLSLILGNKSSTSDGIVAFGVLLGAEAAWLLYAYGPATLMDRLIAAKPG